MTKKPLAKSLKQVFDDRSANYTADVDSSVAFSGLKADFFTRSKAEYFRDYLTETLGPTNELDVLDLGCGIGIFEGLFENDFGSIVGIDVSEMSIEAARKNHPDVEYVLYEGQTLPFPDEQFDVVFTVCVMHHVDPDEWQRFIDQAKRVLKPGGIFAVFEHNPYNPLTLKVVNDCILDEHAVLLKPKELERMVSSSFGRTPRIEFILAIPPINKILKVADRLLKRVPLGAQYAVYVEK